MENILKKVKFDKKDVDFAKKPVISTVFNGLCINYVCYFLFAFPFTIFTFIAYGMLYTYIKNDILKLIKGIIYKR